MLRGQLRIQDPSALALCPLLGCCFVCVVDLGSGTLCWAFCLREKREEKVEGKQFSSKAMMQKLQITTAFGESLDTWPYKWGAWESVYETK